MAEEYQKVDLTDIEDKLFEDQWDKFVVKHFRAREFLDIFQDHKETVKEACRVAKYQLEAPFGGANAGTNQFGWGPILPNHLLAVATPTYATATWMQYITTANVSSRWIDWIGTSASNLKLTKYGTMCVIGFADPEEGSSKIGAILAKIKGRDYPIWDFSDVMQDTDLKVYELIEPFIVEKEQEFYLQQRADRSGATQIRPFGVFFAKGDYMRDKNAYAKV